MVFINESAQAEDGTSKGVGACGRCSVVAFWHLVAMQASARMMMKNLYLDIMFKTASGFWRLWVISHKDEKKQTLRQVSFFWVNVKMHNKRHLGFWDIGSCQG